MPGLLSRRNKFATRFPTQPAPLKGAKTVMSSWLEQATNHPWCLLSPRRPPSEASKSPVLSLRRENAGEGHTHAERSSMCSGLTARGLQGGGPHWVWSVMLSVGCTPQSAGGALSHAVPQPHRGRLNSSLWGWGAGMSITQNSEKIPTCSQDWNRRSRPAPCAQLCRKLQGRQRCLQGSFPVHTAFPAGRESRQCRAAHMVHLLLSKPCLFLPP